MKVSARNTRNLQVEIQAGSHTLLADEPLGVGDDAGPDPYVLLLSALGACKIMTLLMYARRKDWPVESVAVDMQINRVHARDCEDCSSDPNAKVDVVLVDLNIEGALSPDQRQRLLEISERCPVQRTLTGEVKVRTRAVFAAPES